MVTHLCVWGCDISTTVTFNGTSYTVPAIADASWGTNVGTYLIAISTGCLQKSGGAFTLTADADFGASYGLKVAYLKSRTSNTATAGTIELAKTDTIGWRNNANGANLALGINASDLVTFNSIALVDLSTAQTLTNKTFTSPIFTTPALGTPASGVLTNCTGLPLTSGVTGTLPVANGGTGVTASTGTVAVVLSTSPTLVTPLLGTPTSGVLTNCTGLPVGSGISGLGTNVATFLATPSSANLIAALTDETGTGAAVFANTPTLVTPEIGVATGTSLIASSAIYVSGTTSADADTSVSNSTATYLVVTPTATRTYTFTSSGILAGKHWIISNNAAAGSGFNVIVQAVSAETIATIYPKTSAIFICAVTTPTSAAKWSVIGFPTLSTQTQLNYLQSAAGTTGTASTNLVFSTSPTFITPVLGTPSSGTLTSCTGLPISSGVSGLGSSVATFLATPSSANLIAAMTDETGTGACVFATSPTLVTPILGTPSSGTLTSCTGLPLTSGVTGTLPVANGGTGITSFATGIATFLGTSSSANLAAALTDETGTGVAVFGTSPTITTPNIVGTVTNNNAAAGSVGELIEGSVTTDTNIGATNVWFDATTATLTAGDWDVWGCVWCDRAGATFSSLTYSIGIWGASGNSTTGAKKAQNFFEFDAGVALLTFGTTCINSTITRVQSDGTNLYICGTTTSSSQVVRLKAYFYNYTAGQPTYQAYIRARRVR